MNTIVPTCDLVREAVSARLDNEDAQLSAAEIEGHLVGCPACRLFAAGATTLRCQATRLEPSPVPTPVDLLAAVAATPGTPSMLLATRAIVTRLRCPVGSRRVPLALAAMALVVALPIASVGALSRVDFGHTQSRATCSTLLLGHHHRA
jgi:predicted anti-sigma-YlaC factor YlaD